MRRHQWLAAIPYTITVIVSGVLGSIYLFRGQFMPYHADALGMAWGEVGPDLQVLLIALMQVAGAGWLTLAVALAVLLTWPFRQRCLWARLAVPGLIVAFYLPTLIATLSVTAQTPAIAPWYGNVASLATAGIGLALDFTVERSTASY